MNNVIPIRPGICTCPNCPMPQPVSPAGQAACPCTSCPSRPAIQPAGQVDTGVNPWIVAGVVIAGLAAIEWVRYASKSSPSRPRSRSRISRY